MRNGNGNSPAADWQCVSRYPGWSILGGEAKTTLSALPHTERNEAKGLLFQGTALYITGEGWLQVSGQISKKISDWELRKFFGEFIIWPPACF